MQASLDNDNTPEVILRDERNNQGTRFMRATITPEGDLRFEGQDLGKGVQEIFGYAEYEWIWTVKAQDLARLEQAMGRSGNLLQQIKAHFSNENAATLSDFLQSHEIPYEVWSRIGD